MASRLRSGSNEWDQPSEFFNAPDRNMTGCSLFTNEDGKMYHFNGIAAAGTWGPLALAMRTSTNNGETWSTPRILRIPST